MKFIIHYDNNAPQINDNDNDYAEIYKNARKKLLNRDKNGGDLIQFKKVDIYKKRLAYYTKLDEMKFNNKDGNDVEKAALEIVKSIIILCKEPKHHKDNETSNVYIHVETQTFLNEFSKNNKSIKYEFKNNKLCGKSVDLSNANFNTHFESYVTNDDILGMSTSNNPNHEVNINNYDMVKDTLEIALQQFTEDDFENTKEQIQKYYFKKNKEKIKFKDNNTTFKKEAIINLMAAHRKAVQTKKNNNDDTNIGNYEFNEGDILDFAYNSNLDLDTNKVYVYVCQDDNDKDKDKDNDNDKTKENKQTKFRSFISSLEKYRTHWEPETDGKTFISTEIAFLISKGTKEKVTYNVIIPKGQADFQMNFGPSTTSK